METINSKLCQVRASVSPLSKQPPPSRNGAIPVLVDDSNSPNAPSHCPKGSHTHMHTHNIYTTLHTHKHTIAPFQQDGGCVGVRGQPEESVLAFHHVGSGINSCLRLGDKSELLYPLSHLVSSASTNSKPHRPRPKGMSSLYSCCLLSVVHSP